MANEHGTCLPPIIAIDAQWKDEEKIHGHAFLRVLPFQ